MKVANEIELKLDAPPGFELPDLDGEPLERRTFTSVYYDVPGLPLGQAGLTLRRRIENGVGLWQLKLPAVEGRLELEQPGGPTGPPEELARLLVAHTRRGALQPVAELRTVRTGLLAGAGAVEVVLDDVSVMDGRRVADRFGEIELELRNGDGRALKPLARRLRGAGAREGAGQPKLLRVLGGNGAEPAEPLRRWWNEQVREILAHDPGTRLDAHPEDLHRHRVAVRRLRALLRAEPSLLPPERHEQLRVELKWLGTMLGDVRDLDVMLGHLRAEPGLDGREAAIARRLFDRLERQRRQKRRRMLAALDSTRYLALLDELEVAVADLAPASRRELDAVARKAFQKLAGAIAAQQRDPTDAELHGLRICGKRARYAAELAGLEGADTERLVAAAKHFQDVLGEHQDAVVLEQRLRALVRERDGVPEGLVLGRLIEREQARRAETRNEWRSAWKRLRKAGRSAWP